MADEPDANPAPAEPTAAPAPASAEPIDLSAIAGPSAENEQVPAEAEAPPQDGGFQDAAAGLAAGSGVRVKLICTNCNAASLSVNGLSGEHVRVWMDGMPTVSGLGTVYAISQFPSDFIGYTHVSHGPGSVLSGSAAIGGSIEMHSIERTKERRALLDVGIADDAYHALKLAGADRFGPFGALVYLQAAEQNHVDASGEGWQEIADFERVTGHGMFDFHLSDEQVLTVEISSYGENQVRGPGAPEYDLVAGAYTKKDEDAFFNWQTYGLRWKMNRSSGLSLLFGGRYSRRQQQQWTLPTLSSPEQDWTFIIEDEQAAARFQAEIPLASGVLTAGMAWSHMNLQVSQRGVIRPAPHFIVDNLDQNELWVEYARSLGRGWDFSAGLRGDWFDVYGHAVNFPARPAPPIPTDTVDPHLRYNSVEPRVQAHYRPNDKLVLGVAIGKGAQGPAPAFSETCCGAQYQRSLRLRPQEAWSFQLSSEWHPTADQRVSLRAFHTDFDDYQTKAVYHSQAYIAYYTRKNYDEARVQGVDLVHDMRFKDDRYNVGWTWTIADSEGSEVLATNENNEIIMGPTGPHVVSPAGAELPFTPKHSGSAYFRYHQPVRGTSLNVNVSYQGSVRHFELSEDNREETEPWPFLESEPYWTADFDFEQRIGKAGWSVYGGLRNINDYVQNDLGDLNRIYDWGPIQGRTAFVGMKFGL